MGNVSTILLFFGGPLDGSASEQPIPEDWQMIRYEHVPRDDRRTKHVYTGNRKTDQQKVELRYIGSQIQEGYSNA